VNPCYICGKSAGVEYGSHLMTDTTDTNGQNFGDRGLCLCIGCLRATEHMTTVEEFEAFRQAYRAANKPQPPRRPVHQCQRASNGKYWAVCCVCNGRIHLLGCTAKMDPKKDCCEARHKILFEQGQTVGINDPSQPMWDQECLTWSK